MERGEGGRISQLNFSGAISLSVYAELRRTPCGVMGRGLQTFLLDNKFTKRNILELKYVRAHNTCLTLEAANSVIDLMKSTIQGFQRFKDSTTKDIPISVFKELKHQLVLRAFAILSIVSRSSLKDPLSEMANIQCML